MKTLDSKLVKTAEMLKALGHPLRIEILRLLSNSKAQRLTVKQIHENLDISQPDASKHLILMKNQGLLACEKKEGHSFYRINDEQSFIKSIISYLRK